MVLLGIGAIRATWGVEKEKDNNKGKRRGGNRKGREGAEEGREWGSGGMCTYMLVQKIFCI